MKPFSSEDPRYPAYRIKCAELDGYSKIKFSEDDGDLVGMYGKKGDRLYIPKWLVPTYLDDVSLRRVISNLDKRRFDFIDSLSFLVFGYCKETFNEHEVFHIITASNHVWAEALCRVLVGEKEK